MVIAKGLRLLALAVVLSLWLPPVSVRAAGSDTLARADELYGARKDRANVLAALDLLAGAEAKDPGDYEVLWRLARCHWFLGDRAAGKDRLHQFEQGRDYASRAVEARADGLDGHYWYASLIGCVGQEKGILNSLFMVAPMKKELDRCLEIDPKFADAHDVLAQLLWKVPGWPVSIGDRKKAQEEAKLATTYSPDDIEHWLHYGQIAAANRDYKTARLALQKVLSLPGDPEDPEGNRRNKDEARKELAKIEGR